MHYWRSKRSGSWDRRYSCLSATRSAREAPEVLIKARDAEGPDRQDGVEISYEHSTSRESEGSDLQKTEVSRACPLGATVSSTGTNFSVFSVNATQMEIVFFDDADASMPARVIPLDPVLHRTFHYWHIFVPGIKAGKLYGFRADGPNDPQNGHRFDSEKLLIDPYGKGIYVGEHYDRDAAGRPGDNAATAMKSVVVDLSTFDWEGDMPLDRPFGGTVIYEMHVAGFTRHPSSGVAGTKAGTYLGLIEKIPYLQELGVTAVELMPIFQFDSQAAPPGLTNYWGYSPVSFFAPHQGYSTSKDPLVCVDEFRLW